MFVVYGLFSNDEIFYVGKTTDERLALRLIEHKSHAIKCSDSNRKVYNKIRKLLREGTEISIRILYSTSNEEDQNKKEIELISFYGRDLRKGGKLYNSCSGGEGVTGYVYPPEVRKRMSDLKKGHKYLVGKPRPDMSVRFSKVSTIYELDGTKIKTFNSQRIIANKIGVDYRNLSADAKRNRPSFSPILGRSVLMRIGAADSIEAYIPKQLLKVEQYDLTDALIRVYDSVIEASVAVGTSTQNIRSVCNGVSKTAKGYKWKYQQ